jgi:transaldolase
MVEILKNLKIHIYADGASLKNITQHEKKKYIKGYTTNPSLMRKSGVKNYTFFARKVISKVSKKPISFEVFADDFDNMEIQARKISNWGSNVYVKIPVMNSKGISSVNLIRKLHDENIKINVTAIFTLEQIKILGKIINDKTPIILSIFSGRIADTGIDPSLIIKNSVNFFNNNKNVKILWASTREIFNIFQAEDCGCHIITVPDNILSRFSYLKYDLMKFSKDTVKDFYNDAKKSKLTL